MHIRSRSMSKTRLVGWLLPALALTCVGVLGAVRGGRTGGGIAWAADYQTGLNEAKRMHKPLLLSFHTPGCGWCEKLDAETFTDPKIAELSRRYVCVRLDSDVDEAVCKQYSVTEYPLTLLTRPDSAASSRILGYLPADELAPLLVK